MGDNKNTEIGTRTEGEVLSKRNAYSQTFAEPDGSFTTECTIGERFWYDKHDKLSETKYKPIEVGFTKSEMPGYEWANIANSFNFHFKRNLNDDMPYIFNKETSSIGFKSVYMGYCEFDFVSDDFNIKTLQSLYRPNDSIGYISERDVAFADEKSLKKERLIYEDFYIDCDFMYESNNDGVKEFIRIKSKDNLIDPAKLGFDKDNTFLVFLTEIDVDGVDTVKDNSKEIDETKRFNRIDYTVGDDIIFSMPDLKVWEESEENKVPDLSKFKVYTSKQSIVYIDGKMHLLYGISYNDLLEVESYPLIFDPTVTANLTSNFQAIIHEDGNFYTLTLEGLFSGNGTHCGSPEMPGGQFKGIVLLTFTTGVPKNSNISSATLTPQILSSYPNPMVLPMIKGGLGIVFPAPQFIYDAWLNPPLISAVSTAESWMNLQYIVHETVNHASYGGSVVPILSSTQASFGQQGYMMYKPYANGPPYSYLTINYTEGGPPPLNSTGPISMGGSVVGQSINLRLGNAATATINLNTTAVRTLAGKPTGAIDLNSFHGK